MNGTYVADDRRLIEDILREEWGFDGLVMSDWMVSSQRFLFFLLLEFQVDQQSQRLRLIAP